MQNWDYANMTLLKDGKAMFAFDNYNQYWPSLTLTTERTSMVKTANFTVQGLTVFRNECDLSLTKLDDGHIVQSQPKHLEDLQEFIPKVLNDLKNSVVDVNEKVLIPYAYWEVSRVVKECINVIPLRSEEKLDTDEKDEHSRGLRNYRPWSVSPHNCGSNIGFTNVVTSIIKDAKDFLDDHFLPVRLDVDTYMKMNR